MTLNDFKRSLSKNNVKIEGRLNNIIRRAEAGESVPFMQFGKEIFQQVEQTEEVNPDFTRPNSPNRTDKRALESVCKKIVAQNQSQYMQRSVDTAVMTAEKDKIRYAQERHIGQNYIPRKGKSREKFVDAMQSNIGNVFSHEPESRTPQPSHSRKANNWNESLTGLGKTPVAPISGPVSPCKTVRKPSAQTYLKNVSSLGRFGVISHHYDE